MPTGANNGPEFCSELIAGRFNTFNVGRDNTQQRGSGTRLQIRDLLNSRVLLFCNQ